MPPFSRTRQPAEGLRLLAAAARPAPDGAAAGLLQGGDDQCERLCPAAVGREAVSPLEIHRIDRRQRDELGDIDAVAARFLERLERLERLELLGSEHDVLIFRELVALDDLVAADHLAFLDADVLLLQARAVLAVQEM